MDKYKRGEPHDRKTVPVKPSVWGSGKAGGAFIESAISSPEAEASKERFAIDGWEYTEEHFRKFMNAFSRGNNELERMLVDTWRGGGGKAFGLKICEFVAGNLKDIGYKLSVPPYEIVPDPYNLDSTNEELYAKMIRSSSPEEDWIDPRTGVLPSFDTPYEFGIAQKTHRLPDSPFILQEKRVGWGSVADIGYSPLLGKVVVKVSYGNTRKPDEFSWQEAGGYFTSATEDSEASVGVWEAESGVPLVRTVNFGHKSAHPDNILYRNTFTPRLFSALEKTGINFGVQLELVMHPDRPHDIALVQIRPTPRKIFHPIGSEQKQSKRNDREVVDFWLTPIVNGAFDRVGKPKLFTHDEVEQNSERGRRFEEGYRGRMGKGMIGVYNRKAGRGTVPIKWYSGADIYVGGFWGGSEAQITCWPLRPNTHHGTENMPYEAKEKYDFLDEHCGMLYVRPEEIERIQEALTRNRSSWLRVESDGLVGRVSIVK